VNILTALAENESVVKKGSNPERKAIALAWLFHLVGDIHQPLHTAQLFTVEYPNGDRGGNEICVQFVVKGYKDEYPCIPLQHPRCLSGPDSRSFHGSPV
jgi:S1/P1 Nuclease